ncbi:hypothetical protein PAMC26577_28165 [Caballeronia sordidicola]|uniref:Uncharacterized protein n=1 Tax=Caballeronia sordidicola TaxID=196367 RepID=A0A242MFW6_CABSO|nr:hypothetical protein PAMC26577_28165 [Caballeronia sordidicola]
MNSAEKQRTSGGTSQSCLDTTLCEMQGKTSIMARCTP